MTDSRALLPGHVTPRSPALVRDAGPLTVRKLCVGPMENNVYLLTCTATGEQLLIDAAHDPDRLVSYVGEGGTGLSSIVTTHRHGDHVGALVELAARTGAPTYASAVDGPTLPLAPDRTVAQGDRIAVGDVELEVIELRGHTPGAIALAHHDGERTWLFSGDSLFPGGPGKTGSPGDFAQLMDDLEQRVFGVFDDDTLVLPGHGDDTVLGEERPQLGEWRARGW